MKTSQGSETWLNGNVFSTVGVNKPWVHLQFGRQKPW